MAQEPHTMTGDGAAAEPASTAVIRSRIEQTRTEMGETLDAIQSRLSPRRVMTDAGATLRDATVGRVKRLADPRSRPYEIEDMVNAVKRNPVPVALIGIGAMALVGRAVMRRRNDEYASRDKAAADAERPIRSSRLGGARLGLLIGTCAGMTCLSAWRFQQPPAVEYPPLEA